MPNHIGQIPAAAALKFANKEALVFEGKTLELCPKVGDGEIRRRFEVA